MSEHEEQTECGKQLECACSAPRALIDESRLLENAQSFRAHHESLRKRSDELCALVL